jgi:hypothetical protein
VDAPVVDQPVKPGLHVQFDVDPMTRASELADELHGDLCATEQEAEHVLRQLGGFPPLDEEGIALIQRLSGRVAAAQRILERTVDRAARDVGERLAAVGTGVAIHPAAVRDRAAAVFAARERLREADERLVTAEAEAEAEEAAAAAAADELAAPLSDPSDAAPLDRARTGRRGLFGRGRATRARRDEEDTSESTLLLQQMAAATDEAFGARRANEARADLLLLLEAQRDRAREDVRVAHRSWHDLAGESNVEDIEDVVRRFDPQLAEAREVAQEAVGVRAVSTLLERAIARWVEGWRSLGEDPPESVDHEWVESMARRMTRPVVLVADAAALGERFVDVAPAAPVLVVEPAS